MPEDTPAFTLQGGFDMARLHGVYRWMMKLFRGALERQMAAKTDRTPGEELALSMLRGGGSGVRAENLEPVLDWLKDQER